MREKEYREAIGQAVGGPDFENRTLGRLRRAAENPKGDKSMYRGKRGFLTIGGPLIALCAVLLIALLPKNGAAGDRPQWEFVHSKGVSAQYVTDFEAASVSADLQPLTEAELAAYGDVVAATVTAVNNVELDMNGMTETFAIVSMELSDVLSGDHAVGDAVTVRLPNPIGTDMWVEDTGLSSQLRVGTKGWFILRFYQDDDVLAENGATLYLRELCDAGVGDGERCGFIETEEGLRYADWAYPGAAGVKTLDDVRSYLAGLLEK